MQAIRSARTRQMGAAIATNHASLELIASEQPPLLEFQAHVLANFIAPLPLMRAAEVRRKGRSWT